MRADETIWRSEAAFFDRQAEGAFHAGWPPDEAILARYADPRRVWFNKEYRLRRLGDLRGKRVLDVGCGLGDNAILLAARGAQVTGVDVSERSIAFARERAGRLRLPYAPTFVCAPIERAALPRRTFDVVWGDGFLHHVLHDLERVLRALAACARDGGVLVFSEPLDRVPGLRRLRLALPVPTDGTPDERPMTEADLEVVRRVLPGLTIRSFSLLGRLTRIILTHRSYESAPRLRRALVDALVLSDYAILGLPGFARLGGMGVLLAVKGGRAPVRASAPTPPRRPGRGRSSRRTSAGRRPWGAASLE